MDRPPAGAKLSKEQVIDLAKQAAAADERLDLSGCDLRGVNLGGEDVHWRNVDFGLHHGPRPAMLQGAIFRDSTLDNCRLAHADLTDADFRNCRITDCDLRYATFRRTTFEDAKVVRCDLYRANVEEATVMRETVFELVSWPARLEGAVGLRWESLSGSNKKPAVIAESESDYRAFLERSKEDRPEHYSIDAAVKDRLNVAALTYRGLSGLWTGRGQFRDAGKAYVHSRRLERQAVGSRGRDFRLLRWLELWAADLLCGFGESLEPIVLWLLLVALLPGALYWQLGGVSGAQGLPDHLLFSVSQLLTLTPRGMHSTERVVDWIGAMQTLIGIALLGLFGFVLGNKIRNS